MVNQVIMSPHWRPCEDVISRIRSDVCILEVVIRDDLMPVVQAAVEYETAIGDHAVNAIDDLEFAQATIDFRATVAAFLAESEESLDT